MGLGEARHSKAFLLERFKNVCDIPVLDREAVADTRCVGMRQQPGRGRLGQWPQHGLTGGNVRRDAIRGVQ